MNELREFIATLEAELHPTGQRPAHTPTRQQLIREVLPYLRAALCPWQKITPESLPPAFENVLFCDGEPPDGDISGGQYQPNKKGFGPWKRDSDRDDCSTTCAPTYWAYICGNSLPRATAGVQVQVQRDRVSDQVRYSVAGMHAYEVVRFLGNNSFGVRGTYYRNAAEAKRLLTALAAALADAGGIP